MASIRQRLRRRLDSLRRKPRFQVIDHVLVEDHVTLDGCELIGDVRVGFRSYANQTLIRSADIGRYCSIGRRCTIGAASHDLTAISTHAFAAATDFNPGPRTVIGNDVWIGDGAIILAGLTIGDGAVIGGGAVVTRNIVAYDIVTGVPARPLRSRFAPEIVEVLSSKRWWRYGDAIPLLMRGRSLETLEEVIHDQTPDELAEHYKPYERRLG